MILLNLLGTLECRPFYCHLTDEKAEAACLFLHKWKDCGSRGERVS